MSEDRWLPAAQALEMIASRFTVAKRLEAASAREEAKTAIIGGLASGRIISCPRGCLTSAFDAGNGRPGDYSYFELDAGDNSSPISMQVERDGEYVFVPCEFWQDFRDPAAGGSANWHDGDFSFRLATLARPTFVGEVRALHFERATVEHVGAATLAAGTAQRTGEPGRPEKGATLYEREMERRIRDGELESDLAAQARALSNWFRTEHPYQEAPKVGTIANRIRSLYRKAKNPTK